MPSSASTPPPPLAPLCPYTTLFRSHRTRTKHVQNEGCFFGEKGACNCNARACPQLVAGRRLAEMIDGPSVREEGPVDGATAWFAGRDRKSTRLNSSHLVISYAVFC